jgi:type II secretory pathway component GspD/PulD (secretin)
LRRYIILGQRATRFILIWLFQVFVFLPFWSLLIGAQPPLPKEMAQIQSPAVQPSPSKGTTQEFPLPAQIPPQGSNSPVNPSNQPAPVQPLLPAPASRSIAPQNTIQNQPPGATAPVAPETGKPAQSKSPTSSPNSEQPAGISTIQSLENNRPDPLKQPKPSPKKGEVSFNFDDADVYSVIQTIFGGVLRFNYIIDPKVKGRVNFRSVAPVAKEDVLPLMEVILRLNGIGVVEEGGLYRIIPIGDMPREPAPVKIGREPEKVVMTGLGLLQVVPMRYFTSTEMVRVLTPFLSANAVIVDVPKINYLIIVDTDANVKRLLQLVEIFDSEQLKQIKPQVFVYPVQNGKAEDLSNLLQQIYLNAKPTSKAPTPATPATTTPSTPPRSTTTPAVPPSQSAITIGPSAAGEALVSEITKIFPDKVTNSLIVLATPEDYALILETLKKIDTVPRQVMIEVLIAEITLTDELKFGLEWSLKAKGEQGFVNIAGNFNSTTVSTTTSDNITIPAPGFTFLGIDKLGLIRGFLQTLATQGKTKVLASPHILAADNREARIQIGKQVPIVTDVQSTTVTTQTVQYKDTGVILEIAPTINDSGLVSMKIKQEVSTFDFQKIGTNEFPIFTKREASTYSVAQDGQTIVLGGLIQEQTSKSRSGLPFLSKIPILGYLFGYTTDTFDRTEIILLLTPKVVRNQSEAENLTNFYIHRLDPSFKKQIIRQEFISPSVIKETN